ncbi:MULTISPECIES: competence type IV pilus assembly protein ComGB [unclassified Enterococcus]|uniref:competence type IV pilus assembly protein ComGB n=1 Tax=unclassified Enterococcus TaxID=2608891 RepID=UPI001556F699|nr:MULTISPECIES: competence type IV pilus assembly protein ComGB [unclassified Enterococcus]MBS7577267.1 type II secretion system F family protein [Enterococcus sp. MMGLQ5-2]MBS7584640.1 type II secretion system F family protein [Enterococcus sp. MMGLQ5-1]NPD12495.1 type II secretion system F family protein [Enterococcus sp. MMGLQ5-1]NPD37101.1 type II secretion system F family protein [Enterococcus sp. MMGLQ5-2]
MPVRLKKNTLNAKEQQRFLMLVIALLESGFSLRHILQFLELTQFFKFKVMTNIETIISEGGSLPEVFNILGFKSRYTAQIELSTTHGDLLRCLKSIETSLRYQFQHRRKLLQVASYPIILICFLIFLMLGLGNYLLPQLDTKNWATDLIITLPNLLILCTAISISLGLIITYWLKQKNPITILDAVTCLPIVGQLIRNYYTAFFAKELSLLMATGVDMLTITALLKGVTFGNFLCSVGQFIDNQLLLGKNFHETIRMLKFLNPELSLIIQTGELRDNLAKELELYSDECEKNFFYQINQMLQLIQPLIFLIVGIVILCIYAAMLLPIYQNMEDMI